MGFATLEWADWFKNWHLLGPIGNLPSAEAEANFHAALANPAVAT